MGIEQNIITPCNVCSRWYTSLPLHFELLNLRVLLAGTDVNGRWSHNCYGLCWLSHSQSTAESRNYGRIKRCRRCGSRNGQQDELCLPMVIVRMTKTYRIMLLRRALDGAALSHEKKNAMRVLRTSLIVWGRSDRRQRELRTVHKPGDDPLRMRQDMPAQNFVVKDELLLSILTSFRTVRSLSSNAYFTPPVFELSTVDKAGVDLWGPNRSR
jgi:hypothetical protein